MRRRFGAAAFRGPGAFCRQPHLRLHLAPPSAAASVRRRRWSWPSSCSSASNSAAAARSLCPMPRCWSRARRVSFIIVLHAGCVSFEAGAWRTEVPNLGVERLPTLEPLDTPVCPTPWPLVTLMASHLRFANQICRSSSWRRRPYLPRSWSGSAWLQRRPPSRRGESRVQNAAPSSPACLGSSPGCRCWYVAGCPLPRVNAPMHRCAHAPQAPRWLDRQHLP